MLRHLIIAAALVVFVALDLVFVSFSHTPPAALTFAVISFLILVLMAASAGSFTAEVEEPGHLLRWVFPDPLGSLKRVVLAGTIPGLLVAAVAFVPNLSDPREISPAVQLGAVFSVFWLLGAIGLAGAVLGFLWPRTGLFESVLVGGSMVLLQLFLTWVRADITRNELQIGLFNLMIWVSLCLIGAWLGIVLRQIADTQLYPLLEDLPEEAAPDAAENVADAHPQVPSTSTDQEVRPQQLAPEPGDGA